MTTATLEIPASTSARPPSDPRITGPGWGKRIGFIAGILAFAGIALVPSGLHTLGGVGSRPAYAAATVALMAIWWLSEAVPIHWTACVPIVFYPLFGVFGRGFATDLRSSVGPFLDAYIFLFLGGMMVGAAMEESRLHKRVALHIMRVVGAGPKRLLLGMLLATAAVSLWISNTATAVMMMPIGLALVAQLEGASGGRKLWHFGTAIMLAVAYGSNVGGIGTKIGTSTNSIFCGYAQKVLGLEIGFLRYLAFGLPFVILFIPIVWAVLWRVARRDAVAESQGGEVLVRELSSLGPRGRHEKLVAGVFLAAAALWVAGDVISAPVMAFLSTPLQGVLPGLRFSGKHYEALVAMTAGISLLALQALSPASLKRIPWSTLVLLGGSFAMAAGIEGSGLSTWLGMRLATLSNLPLLGQIGLATLATIGLSAVASNTGAVSVLLGVLPRSAAVFSASAIGASCDFMLPAGTPPNAIVFGSGYIRLPVMMRVGLVLDVAAVVLITAYVFFYARHIVG